MNDLNLDFIPAIEEILFKDRTFTAPANAHRDIIVKAVREGRVYDVQFARIVLEYYKQNTCILDVSVNYGQMTIEYADIAKNGWVYSFKENTIVFECLLKNIDAYSLDNVTPAFSAISKTVGDRALFPFFDESVYYTCESLSLTSHRNRSPPVLVIKLDSHDYKLPISCIKTDLQGYDLFALIGGGTIKAHSSANIFEYEEEFSSLIGITFSDYLEYMRLINYKIIKSPLSVGAINPIQTNICLAMHSG